MNAPVEAAFAQSAAPGGGVPILAVKNIELICDHVILVPRGDITKGSIEYRGQRTDQLTRGDMVSMGMVQVMEGRHCFAHLSVEDKLLTGAYTRNISKAERRDALERVYAYFSRLTVRRASLAGYTSGGEQQMTAIGRACCCWMSRRWAWRRRSLRRSSRSWAT